MPASAREIRLNFTNSFMTSSRRQKQLLQFYAVRSMTSKVQSSCGAAPLLNLCMAAKTACMGSGEASSAGRRVVPN